MTQPEYIQYILQRQCCTIHSYFGCSSIPQRQKQQQQPEHGDPKNRSKLPDSSSSISTLPPLPSSSLLKATNEVMCNDEKTSVVERNMLGFFNHCQVVDMSVANKLVNMKFFLKRHPNFPKYTWVIFSHICTLCYKVLMNVLTYTHAIREFLTKIQKPNSS